MVNFCIQKREKNVFLDELESSVFGAQFGMSIRVLDCSNLMEEQSICDVINGLFLQSGPSKTRMDGSDCFWRHRKQDNLEVNSLHNSKKRLLFAFFIFILMGISFIFVHFVTIKKKPSRSYI